MEPSARLTTEIVVSASFTTNSCVPSGLNARFEGPLPTVIVQTTSLVEASITVTRLGEVAMKAMGPVGILAALQAGGAEREGGAKAAADRKKRKKQREKKSSRAGGS